MAMSRPRFTLRIVAFLAAVAMACASLVGFMPVTRAGVFCPTAPVQTVVKLERNCCGKLVLEKRAPRPGEREFVQCRCAEKKSAHEATLVASKIVLFFQGDSPSVGESSPTREPLVASRFSTDVKTLPFVPDVPPPSV
jgi:hypothetical protein